MEIEFKAQILAPEIRQTFQSCLFFAGGAALSTLLAGLYLKNLWPFLAILGALLCWRCFSSYREIVSQKTHPDTLRLEDTSLLYLKNGKETARIPYNAISKVRYEKGEGVGLILKKGARVECLDPAFKLSTMRKKTYDLFFEWFGSSVKTGLDNIVHSNQPHNLHSL